MIFHYFPLQHLHACKFCAYREKLETTNYHHGCCHILRKKTKCRTDAFSMLILEPVHWRIRGEGARDARPPWGSKFFHFHALFGKKLKNNSTFESMRTLLGIILDPPLLLANVYRFHELQCI